MEAHPALLISRAVEVGTRLFYWVDQCNLAISKDYRVASASIKVCYLQYRRAIYR